MGITVRGEHAPNISPTKMVSISISSDILLEMLLAADPSCARLAQNPTVRDLWATAQSLCYHWFKYLLSRDELLFPKNVRLSYGKCANFSPSSSDGSACDTMSVLFYFYVSS